VLILSFFLSFFFFFFVQGKPFNFEYYVFLMKTYKEKFMVEQDEEDSGQHKSKKPKTVVSLPSLSSNFKF